MTVDPSYLSYPRRRRGMDHALYEASYFPDRPPVVWPGGRRLAVWIVPVLEFFPLDMSPEPINPLGGMTRPYPDYWNYTLRDYGNRVGVYRVLDALLARGMPASVAVNSRLAERYPRLVADCLSAGCEIIAHGRDMGTIHGDHLSEAAEGALVRGARESLAGITGQPPRGWLSPAMALSQHTSACVADAGFDYTCDWVNDELPYRMNVGSGRLIAMPLGYELSDMRLIEEYRRQPWEYQTEVLDALSFLKAEADRTGAGRLLALPVHPWIVGVPHRIAAFEAILDAIAGTGAWVATGCDILDAWEQQQ